MNLIFETITLNNFMSYRHSTLDLNGLGYAIISGVNHKTSDSAKSNGSGKSSIFNAICYALTGETSQGLKTNIENIYGDPNDCWVELKFKVDNDEFVLKRIRTPRSDLKIYINGTDYSGKGITESTDLLKQYLPDLTSMLIGSIIILGQGMPYRFTDNHPGGRKEILERLTKSDYMIQSIREKLDMRRAELNTQLRSNEDKMVANSTQTEMYNKQLSSITKEIEDINNYNQEYSLDSRLSYLKNKLDKLNADVSSTKESIEAENKKLFELTQEKNSLLENNTRKRIELCKPLSDELLNLNNKIIELKTTINSKTAEIKKLKSITDICPTCGQKIPGAHRVDTTLHELELEEMKKKKSEIETLYDSKKKDKELAEKQYDESVSSSVRDIDSKIANHTNKLKELNTLSEEYSSKINKTIVETTKVQNMKDTYDKLKLNATSINESLTELSKEKDTVSLVIYETKEHLKVIQDLVTLTKKEFRGVLLENVISYVNTRVKQYSTKVFGAELVSFELNENAIDIMFNGRMFESLSGGEKQKVDIIIQLALRDLISTHTNLHTNILVCDEILDNLDSIGCQKVIDLISNLNDVDSVFIISHHVEDLQISYDTEIVVEKGENGCSSLSIR